MEKEAKNNHPADTRTSGERGKEIVRIEHLKKSFGNNEVLKDISLRIANGENLGIMGKSGTGKSVLIKCMMRLIEPDEGKVMIFERDIPQLDEEELDEVRKQIGFLFQSSALYDSMTVRENLEFALRNMAKHTQDEIDKLVEESLKNVGLSEAIDKMPSELSGGMRKRVGLARTLIINPRIILYDEPTTGLDPITSREISNLILDVQKRYNAASIIITHDKECAQITTNRVMLIDGGVCVAEGKFEEVKRSGNEWVRSFLA